MLNEAFKHLFERPTCESVHERSKTIFFMIAGLSMILGILSIIKGNNVLIGFTYILLYLTIFYGAHYAFNYPKCWRKN